MSAYPETLYAVLRDLVRDPAQRAELGERGARFARERHDTKVVGARLLRDYRVMLGLEAAGAPGDAAGAAGHASAASASRGPGPA